MSCDLFRYVDVIYICFLYLSLFRNIYFLINNQKIVYNHIFSRKCADREIQYKI